MGSLGEAAARTSIFDPVPDDISVFLYLEREDSELELDDDDGHAAGFVSTVLSVSRWSSDGEVWEVTDSLNAF